MQLPIKQFKKKERKWFEKHVRFFNKNLNISMFLLIWKNLKIKLNLKLLKQQNFIEYSPQSTEYLKRY